VRKGVPHHLVDLLPTMDSLCEENTNMVTCK
jgi:hypothetical protein